MLITEEQFWLIWLPNPIIFYVYIIRSNPEIFTIFICKQIHRRRNNEDIVITTNGAYSRLFVTKTFDLCSATFHIYQPIFLFVTSNILQQ